MKPTQTILSWILLGIIIILCSPSVCIGAKTPPDTFSTASSDGTFSTASSDGTFSTDSSDGSFFSSTASLSLSTRNSSANTTERISSTTKPAATQPQTAIPNTNSTPAPKTQSTISSETKSIIIMGGVSAGVLCVVVTAVLLVFVILIRKERRSAWHQSLMTSLPNGVSALHSPAVITSTSLESLVRNVPVAKNKRPKSAQRLSNLRKKWRKSETKTTTSQENNVEQPKRPENVYSAFRRTVPYQDTVQTYLLDRLALASDQLILEFQEIPAFVKEKQCTVAIMPENVKNNRFGNVLPYDDNRVILSVDDGEVSNNDYINASYINGYRREKEYIAAQGPKDIHAAAFWQMIWQEKITHVVMLTNIVEGGRDKCFEYWPKQSESVFHGRVVISSKEVEYRESFCVRTFKVTGTEDEESRDVIQYHYVSWPDFGVPTTSTSLVRFWRYFCRRRERVDGESGFQGPVIVHCSAGVGRSGTFIGLDIAMQQAVEEGQVDLLQLVKTLREQRCLMVQSPDQFIFLHKAVLEAYSSRDTVLSLETFLTTFLQHVDNSRPVYDKTFVNDEFMMLMGMNSLFQVDFWYNTAMRNVNKHKNRTLDVLPADEHIVYLTEKLPDRNQYICAVYMPTFHDSRGCLVTQLPLPSTLVDFWRLVYGNDVTTIVSLSCQNEEEEVEDFCQYWPRQEQEKLHTGPYTVTCQSVTHLTQHLSRYALTLDKTAVPTSCDLQMLHYQGWTGETGGDLQQLLRLVDVVVTSRSASSPRQYVVQCIDGASKSGLFCALCDVVSHMTCEKLVDVYMAVRLVHSVTPTAVTSVEQYHYLYSATHQRCLEELELKASENQEDVLESTMNADEKYICVQKGDDNEEGTAILQIDEKDQNTPESDMHKTREAILEHLSEGEEEHNADQVNESEQVDARKLNVYENKEEAACQ